MTTQELVERLRSYQAYCPQTDRSDHPICTEAADRLSEMDAENKRLREALSGLFARLDHPGNSGQHVNYFLRWPEVETARAALEHDKGEPQP